MFNLFKFHILTSELVTEGGAIDLSWRRWKKNTTQDATKEIEYCYGTKLNFIEGIK